jgi:hypothetical protein
MQVNDKKLMIQTPTAESSLPIFEELEKESQKVDDKFRCFTPMA